MSFKIVMTGEHLLGDMNIELDKKLQNLKDSSEWKMKTGILKKICQVRGAPAIEIFA